MDAINVNDIVDITLVIVQNIGLIAFGICLKQFIDNNSEAYRKSLKTVWIGLLLFIGASLIFRFCPAMFPIDEAKVFGIWLLRTSLRVIPIAAAAMMWFGFAQTQRIGTDSGRPARGFAILKIAAILMLVSYTIKLATANEHLIFNSDTHIQLGAIITISYLSGLIFDMGSVALMCVGWIKIYNSVKPLKTVVY